MSVLLEPILIESLNQLTLTSIIIVCCSIDPEDKLIVVVNSLPGQITSNNCSSPLLCGARAPGMFLSSSSIVTYCALGPFVFTDTSPI